MNILINILIGIFAAYAFQKPSKPCGLGYWRGVAGALGGAVPHIDILFYGLGHDFGLLHQYAESWSLFLVPVFALGIAAGLSYLKKGFIPESPYTWQKFFTPTLAGALMAVLLSVISEKGAALLAPFWQAKLGFGILYSFDIGLFIGLLIFLAVGILLRKFRAEVAELVLVLLIGYTGVTTTFKMKANAIGDRYAKAMELEVEHVYAMPQPLSPFYWRIVVKTTDQRLHDTMVSLKRKRTIVVTPETPPLRRAKAAYKPVHEAVWRIYNRFGYEDSDFAAAAWRSDIAQRLKWLSRFSVLKDIVTYEDRRCARFKDLRFEGAQMNELGEFLICQQTAAEQANDKHDDGWMAYQAVDDGSFLMLDPIY
ncbi:MAG: hypothetical protein CMF62_07810 [Magnetococcales bacterium]|nr:hypothetical protein [Magnetococcales bacterium]